jgi:hypothetical protein
MNQAGNKVARYRFAGSRRTMEIGSILDQRLAEKLTLPIALQLARCDSG